jgi:superfamily II DNA or RNA helicase
VIVDSILKVEISELSKKQWESVEKKLTYGLDNGDVVQSFRRLVTKGIYKLPRGAWSVLPDSIRYVDNRTCPVMPELKFTVNLNAIEKDPRYKGQREAIEAMLKNEQGLIVRPPGTGKTQIALGFAARAKTRTLVIVHTEDILNQWVEYVGKAIPELEGKVGVVRGKTEIVGHITIGTVQTLRNKINDKKFWRQFGAVIADEAHHVAAPSWEAVLNACTARYRFGFTASPTRADGMHPTMRFVIGPIIHRQKFSSPVDLEVRPIRTEFRGTYRGSFDWQGLVSQLISDERRNAKIARIADREVRNGNSVLILSRRIEHLELIAKAMQSDTEILAAATRTKADRKDVLANFKSGNIRCVLATQLADEALDVPRLNRVLLVHPGKHEGRIIQQIGRAIRQHTTKSDAVIFDFVDWHTSVLRRQWKKRRQTYIKEGISIKKRKLLKGRV